MEEIAGSRELQRTLERIDRRTGPRAGRKAVNAASREIAKGVKAAVPPATTPGHNSRNIKAAIGRRNKRNRRRNIQESKIGFSVGKRARSKGALHAHLIAQGTEERKRRRVGGKLKGARNTGTGRIQPAGIVPRGTRASLPKAVSAARAAAQKEIERDAAKR